MLRGLEASYGVWHPLRSACNMLESQSTSCLESCHSRNLRFWPCVELKASNVGQCSRRCSDSNSSCASLCWGGVHAEVGQCVVSLEKRRKPDFDSVQKRERT
eukprot:1823967-Amphidinium_carterae.1